jgi:hypothetical protein
MGWIRGHWHNCWAWKCTQSNVSNHSYFVVPPSPLPMREYDNIFTLVIILVCYRNGKTSQIWQVMTQDFEKEDFTHQTHQTTGYPCWLMLNPHPFHQVLYCLLIISPRGGICCCPSHTTVMWKEHGLGQTYPAQLMIVYAWLDKMVVLTLVFDVSLSADLALSLDVPRQLSLPHTYASPIVLPTQMPK